MNKTLLLILDGWGIAKDNEHNAISEAKPAFWNHLLQTYPNTTLSAKEASVGLSPGLLSNSEVGHITIGAGRIVPQTAFAIGESIANGSFPKNLILGDIKNHVQKNNSTLHLVGLLSDGGIHAHISHVLALLEWAKSNSIPKVDLHLFLDGRDMAPQSAIKLLAIVKPYLNENYSVATIIGRATAMDRAEQWERTVETFHTLTNVEDITNETPEKFIEENYKNNISDEFIAPARFNKNIIAENDAVLFFNFRADRMRQLVRLFTGVAPHAIQQNIKIPNGIFLASMSSYDESYKSVKVLFSKVNTKNNIGEWASAQGLHQLRLTETEKFAHVTYFVNGGEDVKYKNEERLVIPSLGLKNYAEKPEMSLPEVKSSLINALRQKHFEMIISNIPNGDMVGHSGNMKAAITAVKYVDEALSEIITAAAENDYTVVITADHGNIESMFHEGAPHTAHTFNNVPFIITNTNFQLRGGGHLHEIAPTVLNLMNVPQPTEMTSKSLLKLS